MRGFGGRPRKPLFAPRLVLATAGLWFLGMMSMGCGLFTCLIVIVGTLLRKRNPGPVSDEIPCRAPPVHDGKLVRALDHLLAWAGATVLIIAAFYGPVPSMLFTHQIPLPGVGTGG